MNHILFTTLLFANPVLASAFNTSFVGLRDEANVSIRKGNYVVKDQRTPDFNPSHGDSTAQQIYDSSPIQKVNLLTRGQCSIRRATPAEVGLYSAVVAINNSFQGLTGQIVQTDGATNSDPTIVMTALHTFVSDEKGSRVVVDPATGKINSKLFKVRVKGCAADQKVIAACSPPAQLSGVSNDYVYLVLEKNDCQKTAQPFQLQAVEKQDVRNCPKINVSCVLTPGQECGTKKNRDELTPYSATAQNMTNRKLYFGEGKVENVKDYSDSFSYTADTTGGCSGGLVTCDYGNSASLMGIHSGEETDTTNNGAIIHKGMIETLKNCVQRMRSQTR